MAKKIKRIQEARADINLKCPLRIKEAGIEEAKRRGLTLSGLIKDYLANFLPEKIESAYKAGGIQK